jgi:hypothetical protein
VSFVVFVSCANYASRFYILKVSLSVSAKYLNAL